MAPGDNTKILHEKTAARLRKIADGTRGVFGFCAMDLTSREEFCVNEHNIFPQASAIKIPILMEVFKQAEQGKFKLTDSRRIEKSDKTGGSGVLVDLDYGTVQMSLHDLATLMITVSDNTATNMLIDLVGMDNMNATMQSLGLKQTRLQRRMMDLDARAKGNENVSSPAEAMRVMELLYRGEFINRAVCDAILAILRKTHGGNLRAGLPEGMPIAFKPGSFPGVVTEWAIVFCPERPYAVAVMENFGVSGEASGAIREISQSLHQHFSRLIDNQAGWFTPG